MVHLPLAALNAPVVDLYTTQFGAIMLICY